jgi:predicted membrane channel-forming protein YqfA (hemolysin III family)
MEKNPRRLDRISAGYLYFVLALFSIMAVGAIEHRWPAAAMPITIAAGVLFVVGAVIAVWATRRKKHG